MATLCVLKPNALKFIPKKSQSPPAAIINDIENPENQHASPLLRSNKKTTSIDIEQIWTHYTTIYQKNRLEQLTKCNNSIPQEIWEIIFEYEFDHTEFLLVHSKHVHTNQKLHYTMVDWYGTTMHNALY